MKKTLKLLMAMLIVSFVSVGCNSEIDGTKTQGKWYHEVTRNMGGFQISASTELSIKRSGTGDYNYTISTTVIDEMYGGLPKTEFSSGKLDNIVNNEKWKFVSGDFGDRGGWIIVPSDEWKSNPTEITVQFDSGRGNSMIFHR